MSSCNDTPSSLDITFLTQALEFAKIQRGFCSPNPAVGAVIVNSEGICIATGYHLGPGSDHAEVNALRKIADAKGSTVYVTLEPCCHWGRTPPCTDALIKADVARVVFGFKDPNPVVSGKGLAALKAAGILCENVSLPEIDRFYESYAQWQTTQKPFVTAKIALSMNGIIAGKNGERIQITGPELHEYTHYSRKNTDALLTTVETIIHDDPALNARYQNEITAKPLYLLDSQLRLPKTAMIRTTAKAMTVFYDETLDAPFEPAIRYIPVKKDSKGLDLAYIIEFIGKEGVHDLWVEAGGKCFASFIQEKLVQRALIYIAPRWFVNGQVAFPEGIFLDDASKINWQSFGKDVLCDIRW